jgi:hypothetical protein
MPLTFEDTHKLETWSFLRDYKKRRAELIELARAAHVNTRFLMGRKPKPDECVKLCAAMLISTEIFRGMVARKRHLAPVFYKSMCLALATYVLHTDWAEIVL